MDDTIYIIVILILLALIAYLFWRPSATPAVCPAITDYLKKDPQKVGTFMWNITTGTNTWSRELIRMYGFDERDPTHVTEEIDQFTSLVDPADAPRLRETLNQALKDGTYQTTFRIRRPDGIDRKMLACGKVIYDDNHKPILLAGFNVDITSPAPEN